MNLFQISEQSLADAIDINEFVLPYEEWINNSGLLNTNGFNKKHKSEGVFKDNTWILFNELNQVHLILDFKEFNNLAFKKHIKKDEILTIKCWLVSKMQEGLEANSIHSRLRILKMFIKNTNNFDEYTLNSNNGDALFTLIRKLEIDNRGCSYLKEYLEFLDSVDLIRDGHINTLTALSDISVKYENSSRSIPSNKDILAFEYYINKFFKEEKNTNIVNYYKPLMLWWKITTVIPMRASEFAFKLKRDCLMAKDGEYYLKIDRVKINHSKRNTGRIPILNKVRITKDIYELISDYLEITSFDETSNTLVSYEALVKFRRDYCRESDKQYNLRHQPENKGNRTTCTQSVLSTLLASFYSVVIKGFYNEFSISEQLTLGDTRHLAFSSLVLQGLSPIEIAMLGGHTTLSTQDSYTGHINYYIDSEILDFVSNRNIPKEISDKNLINIIFNKPPVCPRFLADCHRTEDGVGYCTLDTKKDAELCDNVDNCIYCRKWWCEPSNENYLKVKHYMQTSTLEPLKATIKEEEQFLLKLLSEAKTINLEGLLELEKEYEEQIAVSQIKLRSNVDKMLLLKKSLLEFDKWNNEIGEN